MTGLAAPTSMEITRLPMTDREIPKEALEATVDILDRLYNADVLDFDGLWQDEVAQIITDAMFEWAERIDHENRLAKVNAVCHQTIEGVKVKHPTAEEWLSRANKRGNDHD
jgi:hypothetical protein